MGDISIKIDTARVSDIEKHLTECMHLFIPPLNTIVSIPEFAKKIRDHAATVEAWDHTHLIGLIACYLNSFEKRVGFITSVSVDEQYAGKGLGKELLIHTCNLAKSKEFDSIELEVFSDNEKAIHLYESFDFKVIEQKNAVIKMEKLLNK